MSMQAPTRQPCPICRREARPRPENKSFPFCSSQCKLIDLERWLEGSYRLPGPPIESTAQDDMGSVTWEDSSQSGRDKEEE